MAKDPINELRKIKGVDRDLAERLVAEKIDSPDKILVAGERGLKRIKGFDEGLIEDVLHEAAKMTDDMQRSKQTSSALVEEKINEFKDDFRVFMEQTRERYADKMDKDKVQAFIRESNRLETALAAIEKNVSGYLREIHRSLDDAESKISELSDDKIRQRTKTVKKARKNLSKVIDKAE